MGRQNGGVIIALTVPSLWLLTYVTLGEDNFDEVSITYVDTLEVLSVFQRDFECATFSDC